MRIRPGRAFPIIFFGAIQSFAVSGAQAETNATTGAAPAPVELPPIKVIAGPEHATKPPAARKNGARGVAQKAAQSVPEPAAVPASGSPNIAAGYVAPPAMASQVNFTGEEINARPVTRPGEVLEADPGLIVTQHSGEGKANQYFLRGYNLDHGTDLAIWVDGVPVNLRTHAHGQGYADLNWLIPETVNAVEVRKGPYFADEGDFGSAGSAHVSFVDSLDKTIVQTTIGSFGYERVLAMESAKAGNGTLLFAGETAFYNGPWLNPDDMQKFNGMLRYSQGTAQEGLSVTAQAYSNKWNSTDQVPLRAWETGQLNRYGEEDPTDGGNVGRFALSVRAAGMDALGPWNANAYAVKSELDLYNNFTYYLTNPIQGDQFHQHDDRILTGANAAQTLKNTVAGLPVETTFGIQTRYDDIHLGLTDTYQRAFLSNVRSDNVGEGSIGVYGESTVHWTNWFRTTLGWRGDYFSATVDSIYDANNSGHVEGGLGSPKFTAVLGPFAKTELFFGAGEGMHSNDARGATITEEPTDPTQKLSASPLLVRTQGAEAGIRTKIIPGLDSSVGVFILDQASEIIFQGDAGDTSASRPSQRYGVEFTNKYHPVSWLTLDGDLALTHARFIGYDSEQAALYASLAGYPQAQLGNAPGNYIPNAPAMVASAGIMLGEKTGWFGGLRYRYLGVSPLTEDNAFRTLPISVFNARLGYQFESGWKVQLDALNLFNAKTDQIAYAYGSLLKTDSLYNLCYPVQIAPTAVCQTGVMDRVSHPMEPLALRLTLSAAF
jgi:outer membrane receptor protein involved in Fe transport